MKKVFFLLVAISATSVMNVHSKGIEVGVKGGLSVPRLTTGGSATDTPLSEGYSSIMTLGGGVFADFLVTKTFSIQTGLEYSRQGGQKTGVQALPAPDIYAGVMAVNPQFAAMQAFLPTDYLYADYKSTARFNYLMLPLQAKLGWHLSQQSPFRVYVSAGVFGSYLMSADQVSKGTFPPFYANAAKGSLSAWALTNTVLAMMPDGMEKQMILGGIEQFATAQQPVNETKDMTPDIRRGNYGVIGAVGLTYKVSTKGKLLLEAGGNYGLMKLQKEVKNGQNRIGAASLMLGYAFLF